MNLLRWKRKKLKKVNIKKFLIISFYFIMTSFAWFSFSKRLDNEINLDMVSWNVIFSKDNNVITNTENIDLSFTNLYPSTSDSLTIDIQNNGQSPVKIVYIIKNITIMGKTYNIKDDINAEKGKDYIILGNPSIIDERYGQDILNNETLLNNPNILEGIDNSLIVDNEYTHVPFYLTIDKTERLLTGERGTVNLAINWPAEDENIENKDLLDSTWGHSFAKYMKYCQENNIPLESTISVNMQLIATQEIEGENT